MVRVTKLVLITLMLACLGCGGDRSTMPSSDEPLTDAQVVAVLVSVHEAEVHAAEIATRRGVSQLVLGYAARMQHEHRAAWDRLTALATQRGYALEGSALSQHLTGHAAGVATQLEGVDQDDFDAAYLEAQVQGHQRVRSVIDDRLMPRVTDADLRVEVSAQRVALVLHEEHAEGARRQLGHRAAAE